MNTTTSNNAKTYVQTVLLTQWKRADDGGWVVGVWGCPGIATQGKDEREARLGIIDVYLMTLDALEDDGLTFGSICTDPTTWEGAELRWVRVEHSERVSL